MKKKFELIKSILLIGSIFLVIYSFNKLLESQINFYSKIDIENLKLKSFWIILILELLIILLFCVKRLKRFESFKESFYFLINIGIASYFLFIPFQSLIIGSLLYINRIQTTEVELIHKYKIVVMYPGENYYSLRWLYDFKSQEVVMENFEVKYKHFTKLNKDDTISLKFKKGKFGIKHSPSLMDK